MKVFRSHVIQTALKFLTLASLILLLAACSVSVIPEVTPVTPTPVTPTNPGGPTPPPTSGANTLLVNPSFDTTDAWTVCAGANQGNYTIGTGDFAATGTACAFQTLPIADAGTYTLVCNAKSDALTSTISLSMLDASFTTISDVVANVTSATLETITLSLSSIVNSEVNTAYVSATLYSNEGTSTIADCGLVKN